MLRANNCIVNDINNIELGYNTIDNCEYIDYDSVSNIKASQKDLCVVQINTSDTPITIKAEASSKADSRPN